MLETTEDVALAESLAAVVAVIYSDLELSLLNRFQVLNVKVQVTLHTDA